MRWERGRRSTNVEDRRGQRMPLGGGGLRLGGGTLIVIVLGAWLLGANPLQILALLTGGGGAPTGQGYPAETGQPLEPDVAAGGGSDPLAQFVSVVLADTEDTWGELFARSGARYEPPRLVLFSDAVRSACGFAQAAMGPFYCPADRQVYIDLSFYRELRDRFGAPGDFAQAYVIAHEIGHHVQNLLGLAERVHAQRERLPEAQANQLSVRMELQADCYAGVWAHHADRARGILESGDVEEGLQAAAAIGDDRIQRQTQGTIVPEAFTHGSSEQRVRWFRRGLETGDVQTCDTFSSGGGA
jgi:predicted metalloprotease